MDGPDTKVCPVIIKEEVEDQSHRCDNDDSTDLCSKLSESFAVGDNLSAHFSDTDVYQAFIKEEVEDDTPGWPGTSSNQMSEITNAEGLLEFESGINALVKQLAEGSANMSSLEENPSDEITGQPANTFMADEIREQLTPLDSSNVSGLYQKSRSGDRRYACEICGKLYIHGGSLNVHKKSRTPYSCEECEKKFDTKCGLTRHLAPSEVLPFVCEVCGERYSKNLDLIVHRRIHFGERPYSCDECAEEFSTKFQLYTHSKLHKVDRPYPCEICHRRYVHLGNLTLHKRSHTWKGPFNCDKCDKNFDTKCGLTRHRVNHGGRVLPYACEICGNQYSRNVHLNIHKMSHSGEKPYSCEECDEKFATRIGLIDHRKLHSSDRPHVCDTCGKRYVQKEDLITHKKSHTREKPYNWRDCSELFVGGSVINANHKIRGSQSSPVVHKTTHRRKNPFRGEDHVADSSKHRFVIATVKLCVCTVCNKSFTTDAQLIEHVKLHNLGPLTSDIEITNDP